MVFTQNISNFMFVKREYIKGWGELKIKYSIRGGYARKSENQCLKM
jgi:hypothetical protein